MIQGKVVRWFQERGYGFLIASETKGEVNGGQEFFFHQDDLPEGTVPPRRGSKVTFEVGEHRGRKKAANVRVTAPPRYVRVSDTIGAPTGDANGHK